MKQGKPASCEHYDLVAWKDNPRRNLGAIEELAASMLENGIKVPLIVRDTKGKSKWEVIAGNRRLAALNLIAKKDPDAKVLSNVPIIIEELNDEEARRVAILENVHRENLAPIDEAENFAALIREATVKNEKGDPIDIVAVRTGKRRLYIMRRISLIDLPPEGKQLLADGRMTLGAAFIFSRMPDAAERKEAIKYAKQSAMDDSVFSETQAKEMLERAFSRSLSDAPWKHTDPFEEMKPSPGPCTGCANNSSSQNELFADVKDKKHICMMGDCYRSKVKAYSERVIAEAKKKGMKIITGDEARQSLNGNYGAKYMKKNESVYEDAKSRKAFQILTDADVETPEVLAVGPDGAAISMYLRSDVMKACRELNKTKGGANGVNPIVAERKKKEHFRRAGIAAVAETVVRTGVLKFSTDAIRTIAKLMVKKCGAEGQRMMGKALGLEPAKSEYGTKDYEKPISALLNNSSVTSYHLGIAMAALLADELQWSAGDKATTIMKLVGVEWKKCQAKTADSVVKAEKLKASDAIKKAKADALKKQKQDDKALKAKKKSKAKK